MIGAVAAVGLMATAAPSVTVGDVKTGEPWSTITVGYTLSGVDADLEYKVAFDVTANGVTKGVTNAFAKLTDGTASKVIDAAALFGPGTADPRAKVRVSLIASPGGVQLWENGPYWAESNVGATKPEEYGYYFWWGDAAGYRRTAADDGWIPVGGGVPFNFSANNCPTYLKDNDTLQSEGYIDATGRLEAEHDAATAHLGSPWRMPTSDEMQALINNCTTTWTARNGVYGRLVTGTGAYATKSIFLPAAGYGQESRLRSSGSYGYYWSSEPRSNSRSNGSWNLNFSAGTIVGPDELRYRGQSVRPVREGGLAATVVAYDAADLALMPPGAQKIGDEVFAYVNADGALVVFGEGLRNPQFNLESLAGAIVFRTAIHEDGSLYTVPTVVVPGHAMALYGTESLENPDWREIDPNVQMQKSGCHFFKFVLK